MKLKIYFDERIIDFEAFTELDFREFSKNFFGVDIFTVSSKNTNDISINTKQVLFLEELKK